MKERADLELAKSQKAVENREKWTKLVVKSSVVPQRSSRLRDRRGEADPPSSDMDSGTFKVRTDVHACDCTLGCTDTVLVRETALKIDSWRKIPCRSGESNLRQRHADPALHELSYIPTLSVYWYRPVASVTRGFLSS